MVRTFCIPLGPPRLVGHRGVKDSSSAVPCIDRIAYGVIRLRKKAGVLLVLFTIYGIWLGRRWKAPVYSPRAIWTMDVLCTDLNLDRTIDHHQQLR